ncbi:hypothetical protein Vretimale_949 [Volvox reticuliferus]|uniref:Uncharacterized protein n=1 Tax=Volvox reticuliferus TaxID=1737510 RepID=A0A8J4CMP8_9CHLO|nr:hypothetical protein Vretifemale_10573 [Volvox reticuliferus]GIL94805.1 hypothetical protein Vretimale_949 [Volvox reticuliferus]
MDIDGDALDAAGGIGSNNGGGGNGRSAMFRSSEEELNKSVNVMAADTATGRQYLETAVTAASAAGDGGFAADRIPAPPEGEAIDYRSVPPSFVAKGMAPRPVSDRALMDGDVISMPRRSGRPSSSSS